MPILWSATLKYLTLTSAALLAGCAVYTVPPPAYVRPPTPVVYVEPTHQSVVSVYIEPPLFQPPPVRVMWAPPPMLVELVPPQPNPEAVWTGGYWVWESNWVWAHGRWTDRPRPGYGWVHPYYEHRDGAVIFVNGFWSAPGARFVAPGLDVNISLAVIAPGVTPGPRPIGPVGVFVPPPPGSRMGLIIPAPVGTPPAVVLGVPPVVNEGMRVHIDGHNTNNTVINNVMNVGNVTIVAPASATASGQAVHVFVPAQGHVAAAQTPMVKALAPLPISATPIPAFTPTRAPVTLPAAQIVRPEPTAHDWRTQPPMPEHTNATSVQPVAAPPTPAIQPAHARSNLPAPPVERANPYAPTSVDGHPASRPQESPTIARSNPASAALPESQRNTAHEQRPQTPVNKAEHERRSEPANKGFEHAPKVSAEATEHTHPTGHEEMPARPAHESRPTIEQRPVRPEGKPVEGRPSERERDKEHDKQRERE